MTVGTDSSDPASRTIRQLAVEVTAALRQGQSISIEDLQAKYDNASVDVTGIADTLSLLEEAAFQRRSVHSVPGVIDETGRRRTSLGGFSLLREISRGGMGIVYEATQEALARQVAIKVLPPSPLLTDVERERFRREGQAAARLHHEHIVPVFATGLECGIQYCVMQLIDGSSLEEIIKAARRRRDHLPLTSKPPSHESSAGEPESCKPAVGRAQSVELPSEAAAFDELPFGLSDSSRWRSIARVGADLADALHHAHGQQVLHRDIKPGNVLVDRSGRAWLTDFGLARLRDSGNLTEAGGWLGTLRYTAPEQLDGQADERSDIYALGVTLYEFCTLEPAFPASDRMELVRDVMQLTPKRPRELVRSLPRDLETILLKAMSRDPEHRYPSAADFSADLQNFLSDRPPVARRCSRLELAGRWCRRNRREAWLLCLLLLSMVLFSVTAVLAYFREAGLRRRSDEIAATAHNALDRVYEAYLPESSELSLGLAHGAVPVSPEAAGLLEELVDFYDELQRHAEQDASFRPQQNRVPESAVALRRVGLLYHQLGRFGKSRQALTTAGQQLFRQYDLQPSADVLLEYARVRNDLGALNWSDRPVWTERHIASIDTNQETTLRLLENMSTHDVNATIQRDIDFEKARTLYLLGRTTRQKGARFLHHLDIPAIKFESPSRDRLRLLKQAVSLLEQLRHADPADLRFRFLLALCLSEQSSGIVDEHGQPGDPSLQLALQQLESLVQQQPQRPGFRFALCTALRRLQLPTPLPDAAGDVLAQRCDRAISMAQRLVEDHPGEWLYVVSLLESHQLRMHVLKKFSRLEEALESCCKAVDLSLSSAENDPANESFQFWAGYTNMRKCKLLIELQRPEEAEETSSTAAGYLTPLLNPESKCYPLALRVTRNLMATRAGLLNRLNRHDEAHACQIKADEYSQQLKEVE
ncbi:MAG: serine/threonine-protein kinase [Planctomycetaceae bacterium]